jgi:hypothetical protein
LLPADHSENIVTVGFHATTTIIFITNNVHRNMLSKIINSSIARFRHTPNNKGMPYIN